MPDPQHVDTPRRMATKRPARKLVATGTTLVTAVLAVLVAFGVDLTDAQTAAILGLAAVLAPLLGAAVGYLVRPGQLDVNIVDNQT